MASGTSDNRERLTEYAKSGSTAAAPPVYDLVACVEGGNLTSIITNIPRDLCVIRAHKLDYDEREPDIEEHERLARMTEQSDMVDILVDSPEYIVSRPQPASIRTALPNCMVIQANVDESDYPGITISLVEPNGTPMTQLCFVEYNKEKPQGKELCIGAYGSLEDDCTYYAPYHIDDPENKKSTYIDTEFKGSAEEAHVRGLDLESLEYRRGYVVNAVEYHQKEGNPGQIKYFSDQLSFIDKQINRLRRRKSE